jgi:hypothetical protein
MVVCLGKQNPRPINQTPDLLYYSGISFKGPNLLESIGSYVLRGSHWALHSERPVALGIVASEISSSSGTSLATMPSPAGVSPYIIGSLLDFIDMAISHLL